MKNYRLLLGALLMMLVCTINTAEQQLYAFCADDRTVVETRMSPTVLKERCRNMQHFIFEHNNKVIQRIDDGALEIGLPIENIDGLFIFENLLHCDSVEKVQKYINRSSLNHSILKQLNDIFDMPYVRAAMDISWINSFVDNRELAHALLCNEDDYGTPPSSPEYYASLFQNSFLC